MAGDVSAPRSGSAPWVARILFVAACFAVSLLWFPTMPGRSHTAVALTVAAFGLALEQVLRRVAPQRVAGSFAGVFVGAGSGAALLVLIPSAGPGRALGLMLVVVLAFLGAVAGGRAGEALTVRSDRSDTGDRAGGRKVLDTSVVIDGRLADIVASGFLDGTLVFPGFALRELQRIADSSDPRMRARGRRGLEVLERLRGDDRVSLEFPDEPGAGEVDDLLVRVAARLGAPLLTTDFNLNKVAGLHGVAVLNVNDLASALRPVVLPGDRRRLEIRREGKEAGQGVGHLDDGTMVVVDGGRAHLGQAIDVEVTSVLQTPAGKMLFARPASDPGDDQKG